MTTTSRESYADSTKGIWALGIGMFAGVMLLMLGTFQAVQGLAAILNDKVYVTGIDYVYQFDLTTWGWIHMIVGLVAVATGVGLFFEQGWARITGIVLAGISALVNFMFIPYYPIWSLTLIAFAIAVVWALCSLLRNE
ncbi:MAG: hypothetical protein HOQ22_10330 [Nocardioidaceae bacterium]|nr:hypothetical protein [Nocardioidaceae bacterium]NUS51422.1 hypothetical protein [Nocardioidaceae bacterium]